MGEWFWTDDDGFVWKDDDGSIWMGDPVGDYTPAAGSLLISGEVAVQGFGVIVPSMVRET